jgi:hypothetical protein
MLQTDTRATWRCWNFGFQKASLSRKPHNIYLYYSTACLPLCPLDFSVEPSDRTSRYMPSYFWRLPKQREFQFPTISNNNMADQRICKTVATKASQSINSYGNLNIVHCVRWSVFKLQGGGKVNVQLLEVGFVLQWMWQWMDVLLKWHWMWRM